MKSSFHKFTAALLAACLFTLFACSNDDGGENKPPEQGSQNLFCEFNYGDYDCFEIPESEGEMCLGYGGRIATFCRPPYLISSSSSSSSSSITYGILIDSRDSKEYKTVVIGSQTWMADNLAYSKDLLTTNSGSYCNDFLTCGMFGILYNWVKAMTVCPNSWHLPTDAEWTILINYAGGESNAGKRLKVGRESGYRGDGTDDYGFSALLGGGASGDNFSGLGDGGYWWTASDYNSSLAYFRGILYEDDKVFRGIMDKSNNFYSVRCVKD